MDRVRGALRTAAHRTLSAHAACRARAALLKRTGPYASLLAVAEASDAFDLQRMELTAKAAGIEPETVNRALLAATAWASEVTEHWE